MSSTETPSPAPRRRRPLPRPLRRLLRWPALVLVAIYFLIDDVVLAAVRPLVAAVAELRPFVRLAALLDRLPPYPTLILFLVPFAVLEPVKIGGLWLMATGHFQIGVITLAAAHLLSIVVVERLFHATRDKLLTIPWFAWSYGKVMALYDWSVGRLKATEAWRRAAATLHAARLRLRAAVAAIRASRMVATLRRLGCELRLWLPRLGIRARRR